MSIEDLNFAIPGLLEMAAPVSDAMEPVTVLPVHVQGDHWGAGQIGPCTIGGVTPATPAVSAEIRFYHFSDTTRTPSLIADAVVMDSAQWVFAVPEIAAEAFDLVPGLWTWILWETSGETPVAAAVGQLAVQHAPDA